VCQVGSGGDNSGLRGSRVLQSPVAHSWLQGCGRLYTVWAGNLGRGRDKVSLTKIIHRKNTFKNIAKIS